MIPCFAQYSVRRTTVSESRRIPNCLSFGLSTFGLPVLGDMNSPHFLFRIYYTICGTKSQEALEKFFENYREGVEVENAVVTAGGFCAARRVVASYKTELGAGTSKMVLILSLSQLR